MLKRIWYKVAEIGLGRLGDKEEEGNVILINRVSILTACATFLFLIVFFVFLPGRGWNTTRLLILGTGFFFLAIPLINYFGRYFLAKIVIIWSPILFIVVVTILHKTLFPQNVTLMSFFHYRFLAISCSVFPFLIFNSRQKKMIFINLLPSFIVLAFGEYIHEYFGVGLSDFGIMNKDSIVFEIVIVISYFFLLGFVYSLRSVSDRYQKKVDNQNRDLAQVNTEVMIQAEELALSNENLIEANHIIEEQNKMLEEMVEEKTSHLKSVNEQLTLQNNELSEFSFTVSHKLKSPVATISGLINLFDRNDMSSENSELVEYIERSCTSMDELFHEFQEILNLRSELNQKYSRFELAKKFDELVTKLTEGKEIEGLDIKLNDKTINGTLFTNKLKFDSILSHLISNAIKYRSNCREPKVEVTVLEDEYNYYLSVWDNGLGIDLELYREKVFGMFQRFHTHTDGKGLGLYLVRAQAESLGGSATVSSKLNEFTKFDIRFKKSQKVLAEN